MQSDEVLRLLSDWDLVQNIIAMSLTQLHPTLESEMVFFSYLKRLLVAIY
jgi:hypothetical protein